MRTDDQWAICLAHVLGALGCYPKQTIGAVAHRLLGRPLGTMPGTPAAKPLPPKDVGLSADDSVAFMKLFMAEHSRKHPADNLVKDNG